MNILESAVRTRIIAQLLDLPDYMKKRLFTNKVTTRFFTTPIKSDSYTLISRPTAESRMINQRPFTQAALLLSLTFSQAVQAELEVSGYVGAEHRYFWQTALDPRQTDSQTSVLGEAELYWQTEQANDSFTLTAFGRKDYSDDQRSHIELQQAYWQHLTDNTEFSLGSKVVFWGVTESRHLVDVINQTDLIESPDGEDKLGQPMAQLSWIQDWGSLELFFMPKFREPIYAGPKGRLRSPVMINSKALYQSSEGKNHHDFALRFSQTLGDWDIGLSAFKGTSRAPDSILTSPNEVTPYHRQVSQFSLDVQATIDDYIWKLEASYLKQQPLPAQLRNSGTILPSDDYIAVTAGLEYTLVGFNDSNSDLGLLLEYNYDQHPFSAFSDTTFFATRLAFNDFSSSEILAGVSIDLANGNHSMLIEASTRWGENIKVSLEAWRFKSKPQNSALYLLRQDDFISLSIKYYF